MNESFKISHFGVGQPQHIEMLYDEFKKSEKYEDNWSTKILHEGKEKWWSFSTYVADTLKNLGSRKGAKFVVIKRVNEKSGKTFTEITVDGDIMTLPQNNPPTPLQGDPLSPEPKQDSPDWDKINWNKCKTLFAVAAYKAGEPLNTETKKQCEEWADYCMKEERTLAEQEEQIDVSNLPF